MHIESRKYEAKFPERRDEGRDGPAEEKQPLMYNELRIGKRGRNATFRRQKGEEWVGTKSFYIDGNAQLKGAKSPDRR